MSLLSEFEATPQKDTVGSHMGKNKQRIEMIHTMIFDQTN